MRKYTVVILNQLNIKNNKINKIILKKFIMKKKKHSLDKYLVKKKIYRKNYSKISSHFKLLLTRAMITVHPKAKLIYIKKKHCTWGSSCCGQSCDLFCPRLGFDPQCARLSPPRCLTCSWACRVSSGPWGIVVVRVSWPGHPT